MSYSGKTVAQLKELLKERELATDGLKADLVARLESSDKGPEELKEPEQPVEHSVGVVDQTIDNPKDEKPAPDAEVQAEVAEPEVNEEKSPSSTEKTNVDEKPSQLSADQLKQLAIEHLQKKLHRAEKFGEDETATKDLQRQISRIEKFGLDLTTQLAKDLGVGRGPAAAVGKPKFKPKKKNFKNYSNRHKNHGSKRYH